MTSYIVNIINDAKSYLKIKIKYPKRFPNSKIESLLPNKIKIGEYVKIKPNCLFSDSIQKIGMGTYIGNHTTIMECVSIGNYCSISHGVKIGLSNHALDHISTNPLFYDKANGWVEETTFFEKHNKRTIIEHDVLISANALIMSGVTIGTGSVIGAGAFVNKDVPSYSIVVGSPAKVLRKRFDDQTIQRLLESKWWEIPIKQLLNNKQYFNNPLKFLEKING